MSNRPHGHEPRFPGFTSMVPTEVAEIVFVQYGVHAPDAATSAAVATDLLAAFDAGDCPDVLDRGSFVDGAGQHNTVWMAYWFGESRHRSWRDRDDVAAIWAAHQTSGEVGVWRETAIIPRQRLESLYSHPPGFAPTTGISASFDQDTTPYHDYWGAARDRIADSWHEPLDPELTGYTPRRWNTRGRRLAVTAPGNVCLIRTAQDWSRAELFRETYLEEVAPVKDEGVDFIAHTPETGCISARNIREEGRDGTPADRSCTIAWFLSLRHLEEWCRSHKTHLAIYGSFFRMLGKHADTPLDVAFWHEVSVPPPGSVRGEYVNCHADCGLLRLGAGASDPTLEVTAP